MPGVGSSERDEWKSARAPSPRQLGTGCTVRCPRECGTERRVHGSGRARRGLFSHTAGHSEGCLDRRWPNLNDRKGSGEEPRAPDSRDLSPCCASGGSSGDPAPPETRKGKVDLMYIEHLTYYVPEASVSCLMNLRLYGEATPVLLTYEKLRFREGWLLPQCHTTSQWQS